MPTHEEWAQFLREFADLSPAEQTRFLTAVRKMVEDMQRGQGFRRGLRVRHVQGYENIYEVTWAPDGRATFSYGAEQQPGEPHIIWRRIGSHDILTNP